MLNSYLEVKKFIENLDKKPKLLLHACCAPCSTHTINFLANYFDITIYFSNDNIDIQNEYLKRANEFMKIKDKLNKDIKIIIPDYTPKDYYKVVKGYENLGERSIRCYNCYYLRLKKTVKYAIKNNFDFFTTTLSISPYKVTKWINEIGINLENEYKVKYLYSDFKKEEGYKNSIKLSNELNIYRQEYCGCVFSKKERNIKV